jgi:hypothetical protein
MSRRRPGYDCERHRTKGRLATLVDRVTEAQVIRVHADLFTGRSAIATKAPSNAMPMS